MNPALLKPSRHLVDLATVGFETPPMATSLVGDSVTDIEAAQASGIGSIGYANKAGKDRAFVDAGATASSTRWASLLPRYGRPRTARTTQTGSRRAAGLPACRVSGLA
jgi:ribonucleotide monophosphatase NagD (HAD superfamily)